ncbi:secondary thiamine-phosphate synthase enzyme YjbQ [Alkalilimnicola sp. S0819]|uniref:secondary thiamine-phosphate synthase enzyme YjbQ n=1 Tax=Alkalilimnicola sp. S0819 TaxID=2613922 RepID=UPI0012621A6F|nr:secondary thiamine-phosphate synthase enzyme YjbQ [Alkalilimnicola sp. S0819]KAB7619741.1 YjbQ family protein [Alkalilimnicola sp. S0819]MPQ17505.1 YjbQ family protein [Alkalilimnicola sp. S0819]
MHQSEITIQSAGRGMREISPELAMELRQSGVRDGLCHVFLQHTSASLIICENADPAVRRDLERFMSRIAPDGDPLWEHDAEGPDDMPAHVRSVLTQTGLTLPVRAGQLALGTWQGVYLWEHRTRGHQRRLMVTVWG